MPLTYAAYTLFVMRPAPRLNREGRLDGAWFVRRVEAFANGSVRRTIVARFPADGRDQCEAWAHRHGVTFGQHQEVARG